MKKTDFIKELKSIALEMGIDVVVSSICSTETINFIKDFKGNDYYIDLYRDTFIVRSKKSNYSMQYNELHAVFGSGNDFNTLNFIQYNATLYSITL